MRKVSVKNTSRPKSKEASTIQSYNSHFIQTQTATRNKSSHRQSKHRSELHPIQELPFGIIKKTSQKQSGHQRKLSKISEKSNAERDSRAKTFRNKEEDTDFTTSNDFNYLHIQTVGLDGVLTSRNKPQLPTNIAQLNSFKTKNSLPVNMSIHQSEKKSLALKKQWNQKKIPYNSKDVLSEFNHLLSQVQREEILNYSNIYYIAHKNQKKFSPKAFDNQEFEYVYALNDHIEYRYEILRFLGKGSYGQVFKVLDHKTKKQFAIKMIKNKKKYTKQAQIEISILNNIRKLDPKGYSGIVEIQGSFLFRKHQCIVFELLNENIYQVIRNNNFVGLNLQLIKRFSIQILNSLYFLKNNNIIHCDLKPQNILLVESNKARIKLIDFGSSCLSNQILYQYIQSRYYRAPEITLGIPYDSRIDMWSFACILVEMYTGMPLFPGNSEEEQMGYMIQTLGMPSDSLIRTAKRRDIFFDKSFQPKIQMSNRKGDVNNGKKLKQIIYDQSFLSFIQKILKWNPQQRMTPKQALEHDWITDGLPDQIKNLNILFKQKGQNKSKALKQNQSKPKPNPKNTQKSSRQPLHSRSNTRQNKSVPNKDLKSKPNTARKENHFYSIYREPSIYV